MALGQLSFMEPNKGRKKNCIPFLAMVALLIGIVTLAVGIYLIASTEEEEECSKPPPTTDTRKTIRDLDEFCAPSEEAQRVDLNAHLEKVRALYLDLYPYQRFQLEDVRSRSQKDINSIVRKFFKPYVPTPEFLKDLADNIRMQSEELEALKVDMSLLKPKEEQILEEAKMFLKQFFGDIFDIDFYGGDWMFGPNYFCQNRICTLPWEVDEFIKAFKPMSIDDLEYVVETFISFKKTFDQYTANVKLGVETGMVRTKISCQAGADAFKDRYQNIISTKGLSNSSWITNNLISVKFFSFLPKGSLAVWRKKHGQNALTSLVAALDEGFARPVYEFHQFLVKNHSRHCPPDDVSSGVAALPLSYVWIDGAQDKTRPTKKKLPITGGALDGKELYRKIMPRFTTVSLTPEEVFKEGQEQLDKLYPEIVNISKQITGKSSTKEAEDAMRKVLDGDDQWHGDLTFPEIESNATAYARCISPETAQKYCPVRWKSIMKWAQYINQLLAMIHPKLVKAFYFTGKKNSVPNCPVKMSPHYNPSNGAMYFQMSDASCSKPTEFGLPFFLKKYGPKFQEWSVTGHEARPGHHFQMQGGTELFGDPCTGVSQFIHSRGYYVGFIEGWALYGENPVLSDDIDLYKDNQLQKLGMYKWQVWRAVRLVVDTGLHYRNETRTWALEQFDKYTWDTTDFVYKEITRYMSCPGQATGYMIGRLAIIKARRKAELELGDKFNLKDFHLQMLSLGQVPLDYMASYIDRYIDCVKDPKKKFCEYVLTPVKSIPSGRTIKHGQKVAGSLNTAPQRHYL